MEIFLNISPSRVANSFLQQFFLQQEGSLRNNRILYLKNQFKDEQPYY